MKGSSVQAGVAQKVTEGVSHSLGFNRDQGQSIGLGTDNVKQEGSLVIVFDQLGSLVTVHSRLPRHTTPYHCSVHANGYSIQV